MKKLENFKAKRIDKSELFNTMASKIFGGDTSSNGVETCTTGADCDSESGRDEDSDCNSIMKIQ